MRTKETSHFYLGRATDTDRFSRFLSEHYGESDDQPISEFYASQGEVFCDHDFMEHGTREPGNPLEEFFAPYSYSDKWSPAVCQAARRADLDDANLLVFINADQITSPRSVSEEGFELRYLGQFDYAI